MDKQYNTPQDKTKGKPGFRNLKHRVTSRNPQEVRQVFVKHWQNRRKYDNVAPACNYANGFMPFIKSERKNI
ncbi:hypothetical protein HMPREF0578_2011 [Mobiluncus mulieris 28-1]|nr:hypothetical protein HMPREF0578_2011 [Mobiluncus mulieris 28-1]